MPINPQKLSPDAIYLLKILQENEALKKQVEELTNNSRRLVEAERAADEELDLRGAPRLSGQTKLSIAGRVRQWWCARYKKFDAETLGFTCWKRFADDDIRPDLLHDEQQRCKHEGREIRQRNIPDGWGEITTYEWRGWIFERTYDRNKGGSEKWEAIRRV